VVDRLCEDVKHYLLRISTDSMGEKDQRRAMEILQFATNLEHAGDIVEKNLIELAVKKMRNRLRFSDEGMAEIEALHVMLLDLKEPLKAGQKFPVTLTFEKAGAMTVQVAVQALRPEPGHGHGAAPAKPAH
jgi:hypothetical protein